MEFNTSFDIKPKINRFNNNVPQCTVDDAVIIEYAQMSIEQGWAPLYVQNNWIPRKKHLNIQLLLSTFEISLKVHKRKCFTIFL